MIFFIFINFVVNVELRLCQRPEFEIPRSGPTFEFVFTFQYRMVKYQAIIALMEIICLILVSRTLPSVPIRGNTGLHRTTENLKKKSVENKIILL